MQVENELFRERNESKVLEKGGQKGPKAKVIKVL